MSKVYLSSTRLDLEAERRAVTDWLVAAGHQPVHSYVADSETVRDSCLADIADCDLYVLILGHRYGFEPAAGNPQRLSITHLEFRHAGTLGLPRVTLLRTSTPDLRLTDLNDPVRSARVRDFHAEVGNALRPAEFGNAAELITALSTGVQRALAEQPAAGTKGDMLAQVMELLAKRDADARRHEQRAAELEAELRQMRENGVSRVLDLAAAPAAGDLALHARTALRQGDSLLAEQLLRQQEDKAAAAAADSNREAAELAREIAAMAIGRDSQTALAALERAAAYQPEDLWTRIQLGDAQAVAGRSVSALESYQAAFGIAAALAARDPANTEWQRDLSVSHERIGDVLVAQGDGPAALAAFRNGLAILEKLTARDLANTQWQHGLSVSQNKLGDVLVAQGDGPGALAAFRRGFAIAAALAARDPANPQWQRDLSISHDRIGNVLVAQGDGPGALAAFRQGLAIAEALAARDPANTEWQRDLSVSHDKIGDILVSQGDGPDALAAFRKGLAMREALAARDPANTEWQRDLSVSHNKIGNVLVAQSDGPGALATFCQGIAIAAALAARDPANTQWQRDLSIGHHIIGDMLLAQGDSPGALTAFRKGLVILDALTARDPANAQWQVDLAVSCARLGGGDLLDQAERRAYLNRGLDILRRLRTAGRVAANQDWTTWFEGKLRALDDAGR